MFNKFKKTISGVLVFGLIVTSGITFSACRDDEEKEDDKKTEVSTPQDATKKDLSDTDNKDIDNEGTSSDDTATKQLNSLCDELFKDAVSEDAITLNYVLADASVLGLDKYPEVMLSFDADDIFIDLEENDEYTKKLEQINYEALSQSQKITYDAIEYRLDCSYDSEGLEYYSEVLGPTQGFQAELPITLAEYKFYTATDIERYLTALPSIYDTFEEIIKFEQAKSEKGLFMSDEMVDKIVEQCNEFIKDKDNNYLITSFDEKINNYEGLTDSQKKDFCARNKEIVLNKIIPAYELLITSLNDLKGTGTNDGGLCNFEDGRKYYQLLVYSNVGDHVKVKTVKKALNKRIKNNINELSKLYLHNNDIFDEITKTKTAKTDPKAILEELHEDMQADFPQIPEVNYTLKPVDKSLEDFLSPAMYYKPAIDDNTDNSIYINESQIRDTSEFFATLAHEGFPGHMYEYNYEKTNDNSPLRQILVPTGVSEGWAKYVEYKSYSYIEDIPSDVAKAMALNSELSLCIEAVADIGINYEYWTKEDLKEYLSNYFELDDETIDSVYLSAIESPTNVLCYTYGAIVYEELENNAKVLKEDDFNELEFNRFLLDVGFAPFSVIKSCYDKYYY